MGLETMVSNSYMSLNLNEKQRTIRAEHPITNGKIVLRLPDPKDAA